MIDEPQILAESKTAESAQAAAVAKEAEQKAIAAQMAATMNDALESFFRRGIDDGRFVPLKNGKLADMERLNFICDDISGIHQKIDIMEKTGVTKTDFLLLQQTAQLTNRIVFGFILVILLGVAGAFGTVVYTVLSMPKG